MSVPDHPKESSRPPPGKRAAQRAGRKSESLAATAPAGAASRRRAGGLGRLRLGAGAALLVAAFVAGVIAAPRLAPWLAGGSPAAPAVPEARLEQRIAAAEQQLAALAAGRRDVRSAMAAYQDEARDGATRLGALTERLGQAEARLAALDHAERRLDALEALSAAPGASSEGREDGEEGAALAPVRQRLSEVEARLDGLGSDATASVGNRLAALERALERAGGGAAGLTRLEAEAHRLAAALGEAEQRLGALENAPSSAAVQQLALALAVGQLGEALRTSAPYAADLATVRALAREASGLAREPLDGAVATLAVRAETGLPALAVLRRRFASLAGDLARADRRGAESDWVDRMLDRLGAVVQVRRTGEAAGNSAAARVARAEVRLAAADLSGAITEIEGLTGRAGAEAGTWVADAKARLAAEQALRALDSHVLAIFGEGTERP